MVWAKIKGYVIAFLSSLAALWAIYWAGRRRGVQNEQIKRERADIKQSVKIQDAADRARRADGDNVPAIERLRRAKRLRDL
jgi:hypothetical protein